MEMINGLDMERIGFWGLLIVYIIRDGAIPIATKAFPHLLKRDNREQDRADKKQDFEQQMELRQVEAWEATAKSTAEIGKILGLMNERLLKLEDGLLSNIPARRKK